jgi:outer membrane protein OmpA-like peptidoglycan-associated protein
MAGSGYFANPLTLAVAHQQFQKTRLALQPGVAAPNAQAAQQAKNSAKAATADAHQGALQGRVHITGYRSQTWSPFTAYATSGIGGRRATAIANLFRAEGFPPDRLVETDAGGTTKFGDNNDVVEVTAGV